MSIEWIDLARQAAEAGTVNLLITGGEPMLRPDFCDIWEGIYKQGFLIELYTNASLVSDKILNTLSEYPPHKIGVTVYGASSATYEKVCGNGAMFERMLQGVQKLQTFPSFLSFRTTIIKDNYEDVENIEELVRREFHYPRELTETRVVSASVRGACADVGACRLDAKENIDLLIHRAAGMTSYTISWDDRLLPCQLLGNYAVDLKSHSLCEAWQMLPTILRSISAF